MTDYSLLHNSILSYVRGGRVHFHDLNAGRLAEFANRLAGKNKRGDPQGWRLLDRRLQALRKAGKLAYDRKAGWSVVEVKRP